MKQGLSFILISFSIQTFSQTDIVGKYEYRKQEVKRSEAYFTVTIYIKENKTFIYTSDSHLFGSANDKGTWATSGDTLILANEDKSVDKYIISKKQLCELPKTEKSICLESIAQSEENLTKLFDKKWVIETYEMEGRKFPATDDKKNNYAMFYSDHNAKSIDKGITISSKWKYGATQNILTLYSEGVKETTEMKIFKLNDTSFVWQTTTPVGMTMTIHMTTSEETVQNTFKDEQTLTLNYNAISCPCAQWSESKYNDNSDKREYLYLEPANKQLINADSLWQGNNIPLQIQVTGKITTEAGYSKGFNISKGNPEAGKVFRYTKITVLRNGIGK